MKPPKDETVYCGNCGRQLYGKANVIRQNSDGSLWARCGHCVAIWHETQKDCRQ